MDGSLDCNQSIRRAFATCQAGLEGATETSGFYKSTEQGEGSGFGSSPCALENNRDAPSPGGDGSLLDSSVITARKASSKDRRICRFWQRFMTGSGVGGQLRILTLTSSDEAVEAGLDIHQSWRMLLMRLRRKWGRFEYIGVKEVKGDREHLHLCFRGSYMEQAVISVLWQQIHRSPVVDIRRLYSWASVNGHKVKVWNSARGGCRYLCKYLAKEASGRYWASYGWVFKGWVGWSQRVKRAIGHYPGKAILMVLARLDLGRREEAMWVLCPAVMQDLWRGA